MRVVEAASALRVWSRRFGSGGNLGSTSDGNNTASNYESGGGPLPRGKELGGNTGMADYRRVLLAVDLTEECRRVARRAQALATSAGAELHIVHVIEPLSLAYGGDVPMDLSSVQDQIHEQACAHLADFAEGFDVAEGRRHLVFGRPESEIHRIAESEAMDLIVVGSHGRHGLALLLGSTANGVLHGASCDVLAVRVGRDIAPDDNDA